MITWLLTTGTPFWAWALVSFMLLFALWKVAQEIMGLKDDRYPIRRRLVMLEMKVQALEGSLEIVDNTVTPSHQVAPTEILSN